MVCLEPLAEVEGALLVVEVLHLPHPQLGGLGLGDSLEHCSVGRRTWSVAIDKAMKKQHNHVLSERRSALAEITKNDAHRASGVAHNPPSPIDNSQNSRQPPKQGTRMGKVRRNESDPSSTLSIDPLTPRVPKQIANH